MGADGLCFTRRIFLTCAAELHCLYRRSNVMKTTVELYQNASNEINIRASNATGTSISIGCVRAWWWEKIPALHYLGLLGVGKRIQWGELSRV